MMHEVDQDVGHAEITETPSERRENGHAVIDPGTVRQDVGAGEEVQIAGDGFGVGDDGIPAADRVDAENQNHDQGKGHDQALNQTGDGGCHEAAHGAVGDDDNGRDDHRGRIGPAEHGVEQLAAGHKAGRGIGDKENDDDQGADGFNQLGVVAEAAGQVIRHRDGVDLGRVGTQTLGDQQPVQIGAGGKTDGCPAGFGNAAEQRQTRHAHQQIGAHVRGLGAHGGNDRAELPAAEIEVGAVVGSLGMPVTDIDHPDKVTDDGKNNEDCVGGHNENPLFSFFSLHARLSAGIKGL